MNCSICKKPLIDGTSTKTQSVCRCGDMTGYRIEALGAENLKLKAENEHFKKIILEDKERIQTLKTIIRGMEKVDGLYKLSVKECEEYWCQLEHGDYEGWLPK